MRRVFVDMGGQRPEGPEKDAAPDRQDRLLAARHLYEEVQRQFRIHDGANESLEKKAQSLMSVSALVAALLVSLAAAHGTSQSWVLIWWYVTIVPVLGMALTIVLCIQVNSPSDHRVAIKGDSLLCHDGLDEKTYEDLVSDEERYCKLRIEEFAVALKEMEATNKAKARRLRRAYIAFGISVALHVLVIAAALAS